MYLAAHHFVDEPDAPGNLFAAQGTPVSVELYWSTPGDNNNAITSYVLLRVRADDPSGLVTRSYTSSTSLLQAYLEEYTWYNFTVIAVNRAGEGAASEMVSFKTGVTGKFFEPTPVCVRKTIISVRSPLCRQARLTW